MTTSTTYEHLDRPGLQERLDQLTTQYWDAQALVAAIACERAVVMNLLINLPKPRSEG